MAHGNALRLSLNYTLQLGLFVLMLVTLQKMYFEIQAHIIYKLHVFTKNHKIYLKPLLLY